jgi:hypothetical protein
MQEFELAARYNKESSLMTSFRARGHDAIMNWPPKTAPAQVTIYRSALMIERSGVPMKGQSIPFRVVGRV